MSNRFYILALIICVCFAVGCKNEPATEANYVKGLQKYSESDWENAADAFKKASEINPKFPDAYVGLARTVIKLNKPKEASDACKEALKINPQHPEANAVLGYALTKQGKRKDALQAIETAIKLNPQLPEAYFYLGYYHIADRATENKEEAMKAQRALGTLDQKLGKELLNAINR